MSPQAEMSPGTFEARYYSDCPACGEKIRPGDQAKYDGDDVVHDDCNDIGVPQEQVEPPCPRCFQVPSISGTCGCDA